MPDTPQAAQHVRPYVHESLSTKALHFSIGEMQSSMQIENPYALDLEYTRLMMGFVLFKPEPRQIAMIGLGGGSLAKFCHRHLRHTRIEVVEINPHVIALRDEFHVPPDDARFRVVRADGARFVRSGTSQCDVLMVDGFDSQGQPARLSSQRFYDDCRELLQPEGIMVVNLHAGDARFAVLLERIRCSFDDAVLVVHGTEPGNGIVFARKGQAFTKHKPGVVRRPRQLDRVAADALLASFALVISALGGQAG